MTRGYGRNKKEYRVYKKTNIYPFKKYNFLCAIKYGKIVGFALYENLKGGIKKEQMVDFINKFIKNKYKNHYILMDNAPFHKSKDIKACVDESKNKLFFSVSYNPNTNPIEGFFNQLKHYVKLKSPQNYEELNKEIKITIKNYIKAGHLINYFIGLYKIASSFIESH
jgi:transposase